MSSPLTSVQVALLGTPSPCEHLPADDETRCALLVLVRAGLMAIDEDGVYYRTHAGSRYVDFLTSQAVPNQRAESENDLPPSSA